MSQAPAQPQQQASSADLKAQIAKADWRQDLKHVEPAKNASEPAIDPHLKANVTAGKEVRSHLQDEIKKEHRLKPVKYQRDASAPYVPPPINNPDSAKVQQIIQQLWSKDNRRAWLLMGYSGPETVVYQGHGSGPVTEAVAKLDDRSIQYLLVRLPVNKREGEIHVETVRDVFVAWTGPQVPIIEKGKKKVHIGSMAAFLKPSHAELQAVNRDLLTEENLIYCSDPHGAHIIDYTPTTDPKAVAALKAQIAKADWRQDLKHVEPEKNASEPAVDPHLKVDLAAGKTTQQALQTNIQKADWRQDLKHVEPVKNASEPAIDPNLKVNLTAGKQRRAQMKQEITTGVRLKRAVVAHDASAPEVPEPIRCPDSAKVKQLLADLFPVNAQRGWLLLGYKDKETIVYEAHGKGGVDEIVPRLGDDKVQYFLVRMPTLEKAGEIMVSGVRDVLVVWTGPRVGVIEKARKKTHVGGVSVLLRPHHANLTVVSKEFINEANLMYCSDPHGAHIVEYTPNQDPRAVAALQKDIQKADWRQDLNHLPSSIVRDASEPLIEKPPKKQP